MGLQIEIALSGNGVVIHIEEFLDEIAKNEAKGLAKITPDRLKISDRAHLVFELHRVADKMQEEQRKSNKEMLGTTKKGIGPCYSSKASRSGLRICDLVASDFENRFVEKFKRLASDHERAYGTQVRKGISYVQGVPTSFSENLKSTRN